MFTELFAFNDDNTTPLREVTLWKNLFAFCSEKEDLAPSNRTSMPSIWRKQ